MLPWVRHLFLKKRLWLDYKYDEILGYVIKCLEVIIMRYGSDGHKDNVML